MILAGVDIGNSTTEVCIGECVGREPVRSASFKRLQSRPEKRPEPARASAGVPPFSISARHFAVFASISSAPVQSFAERLTASSIPMPLAVAMAMEDDGSRDAIETTWFGAAL